MRPAVTTMVKDCRFSGSSESNFTALKGFASRVPAITALLQRPVAVWSCSESLTQQLEQVKLPASVTRTRPLVTGAVQVLDTSTRATQATEASQSQHQMLEEN